MKITHDSKVDAYVQAIDALRAQECAYDDEGDFANGREWLAIKLEKELRKIEGHK